MLKKILLVLGAVSLIYGGQAIAGGECPQKRVTKAVAEANLKNPKTSPADIKAGEELFQKKAKPVVCHMCHGKTGEGNGPAGRAFKSPRAPRNFTCKETMKHVSEGQMFGIIKHGSPGSGMIAHSRTLKDEQIWQLVAYIRSTFLK